MPCISRMLNAYSAKNRLRAKVEGRKTMAENVHKNEVSLSGVAAGEPEYSHENHTLRFYKFILRIRRLSGQEDELVVVLPEHLLNQTVIEEGARIHVEGQLRSYNCKTDESNHLILTVYAKEIFCVGEEDWNVILLSGVLCKTPHRRSTPLGREICDIMLAVNRIYGRADYIPCVAWGKLAERIGNMNVGEALHFEGRVQSRQYQKNLGTTVEKRTAYEVSVMRLLPESE